MELTLHTSGRRTVSEGGTTLERIGDGIRATFTVREGQTGGIVLESMGGQPQALPRAELQRLVNDTTAYWKAWLNRSTYTGRWREMVTRRRCP
jgi:hypothetical protein